MEVIHETAVLRFVKCQRLVAAIHMEVFAQTIKSSTGPGAAVKTISPLVLTWHIFRQTAVELMISDQTRVFAMPNQFYEEILVIY